MANYNLTPEADADLSEIWDYTDRNWGRNQARRYLTQLENRIGVLAEKPGLGRMRHDIPGEPMSYHECRHVIFYRTSAEGIEVLRVLHDVMDFPRHFGG